MGVIIFLSLMGMWSLSKKCDLMNIKEGIKDVSYSAECKRLWV